KNAVELQTGGAQEPTRSQLMALYTRQKAEAMGALKALRNEIRPELETKVRAEFADQIAARKEEGEARLQLLTKEEEFLTEKVKFVDKEAEKANPSRRPSDMITLADAIR